MTIVTVNRNIINDVLDKAKQSLFNLEKDFLSLISTVRVGKNTLKVEVSYNEAYVYFSFIISDFADIKPAYKVIKRFAYKDFVNSSIYDNVWEGLKNTITLKGDLVYGDKNKFDIRLDEKNPKLGYAFTW